jgi:hypothetical protein
VGSQSHSARRRPALPAENPEPQCCCPCYTPTATSRAHHTAASSPATAACCLDLMSALIPAAATASLQLWCPGSPSAERLRQLPTQLAPAARQRWDTSSAQVRQHALLPAAQLVPLPLMPLSCRRQLCSMPPQPRGRRLATVTEPGRCWRPMLPQGCSSCLAERRQIWCLQPCTDLHSKHVTAHCDAALVGGERMRKCF